ncbi:MAG: PEP/pyruvate-binding domain-containing protein [bacterium]|nr:PEP/pyruvate-binding domain-containing protein [bacterium]
MVKKKPTIPAATDIPLFNRRFYDSKDVMSRIGDGAIGGKATGLAFAARLLKEAVPSGELSGLSVSVPRFVIVTTDVFDAFMERNNLNEVALGDLPNDRIANAFLKAEFPTEFAGDLRGLITAVNSPLAIRSSSMLEDSMYEPFAGVYETKMTPNNQSDTGARYSKLIEAVKFVYASTFFHEAKAYRKMTGRTPSDEKMAVIIQEVVGQRYGDRFYPAISGVARSYNFYAFGHAKPEDGIVDLALGLGKTIVDGGLAWTYCPAYPKSPPPFTTSEMLKYTQSEFWAVNMGKPAEYDPVRETEYLIKATVKEAEYDDAISQSASTYQAHNDRLVMGIGHDGPRVLNFAPLLQFGEIPINELVKQLSKLCSTKLDSAVEIEFAVSIDPLRKSPPRFGLLQVRPMVVSDEEIEITDPELTSKEVIVASNKVLGNGCVGGIKDIIFVNPAVFKKENTRLIAGEIDALNREFADSTKRYILIGFGRWGSSDPWLGIPVDWGNISSAQVLVEATLPDMNVELSQGSHFFHNLTSLQLLYFSVPHTGQYQIDWDWLNAQKVVSEKEFVKHVECSKPVTIKVDGRSQRGVICR